MSGLYVHIPFCTQKCIYCDFMTGTNLNLRNRYIDALSLDMDRHIDFFANSPITTIYFGGGTPSLLTSDELLKIYHAIEYRWDLTMLQEFTIESNPDDLSPQWLEQLGSLPINRLSIGVQSFVDAELQWLNRRHNASQAIEAIRNAQHYGYKNISVDLMFALPIQTLQTLNYSLSILKEIDVTHVSAYSLMFEEGSKISKLLQQNRLQPIDEELAAEMYQTISSYLVGLGYSHYEISNYARQGYHSQHNSSYWNYSPYLGIGASAHSFDGTNRFYNIAHTLKYCSALEDNAVVATVEHLTDNERFNEYVFTTLRTSNGLNINQLRVRHGDKKTEQLLSLAQKYIESGLLINSGESLSLSPQGVYISDTIMSDFMIV